MFLLKALIAFLVAWIICLLAIVAGNADLYEGLFFIEIFQQEGGGFFALFLIPVVVGLVILTIVVGRTIIKSVSPRRS